MRTAASALALTVCLAASGCGKHESATVTRSELPKLVLQPRDVPGFVQFDGGRQQRVDAHAGPRADPRRFGRIEGWKARYKRAGSTKIGPLVLESRADLFESSDGAKRDLDAYRRELETGAPGGPKPDPITAPKLGDARVAFVLSQGSVQFVTIAWRTENATASLTAAGLKGKLAMQDVVALARKQERHLALAAGG